MSTTPGSITIGERTFTALPQTNKLIRELRPLQRGNRRFSRRQSLLADLAQALTDGMPNEEIERLAGLLNTGEDNDLGEERDIDKILDLAEEAQAASVDVITQIIGLSFRDSDGEAPTVEFLDEHMDWRRFDEVSAALGWKTDDDEDEPADPPKTPTTSSTGD